MVNRDGGFTTEDVADAVAVALARELDERLIGWIAVADRDIPFARGQRTAFSTVRQWLAAFTPAEPPPQETKIMRAPTTEADTVADLRGLDPFLSPAASRDVDGDQMFSLTSPSLEQFLARYYSWCVVGNEARGEWFWLDQIEDTIGRERYRQIMRGDKTDV